MTKYAANMRAHSLWHRFTYGVGRRIGTTTLRRRSVTDRCEVGYRELVSLTPERWTPTVMGRGATWEQAFERAEQQAEEAGDRREP